jgi:hypothetical protein
MDPVPDLLEALQNQDNASQLLLHPLKEEVVHRSQIQPIERLLEQLDLVGSHLCLNNVGGRDPRIVPMNEPLLDEPLLVSEDVELCVIGHPHGER